MLRLGVDLDNTLADFTNNVFSRFEDHFDIALKEEGWKNIDSGDFSAFLSSVSDVPYKDVDRWFHEEMEKNGFFFEQDVIEGFDYFHDFFHEFNNDMDVYFVTSVLPTSMYAYKDKFMWVKKHMNIPNPQMIYTQFKHLVNVDILIDDLVENCEMWLGDGNPEMIFLLYPQPYNEKYYQSLDSDSGVFRLDGWKDICDHLRQTLT